MCRPHVRTKYWHLEVLFKVCRALVLAPVHLNRDEWFAKQHLIELSDPKFIETYKILTFVKSNVDIRPNMNFLWVTDIYVKITADIVA